LILNDCIHGLSAQLNVVNLVLSVTLCYPNNSANAAAIRHFLIKT